MKTWKVGDRVSFPASLNPANRAVYTGTIEKIGGMLAWVRDDGWKALSGVRLDLLHAEGAYEITRSGPLGVIWKD